METADSAQFHIVQVQGWIHKDGKFLLAQRGGRELHRPGEWALPGGKVEKEIAGDILQKTLQQEIREEVGLEVLPDMVLLANGSFTRTDGAPVVSLTFFCQWLSGEAHALDDTADVRWFTLDELANADLPDFMAKYVSALRQYIKDHGAGN